ncbi:MAG: glycosyltransferase family 39 protein [Patescibacteria group bacterium]
MKNLKTKFPMIEIAALLLLIAFFPLIAKVNFMQNDDWNRTTSVARFLNGDFKLLDVTATTFYTQGVLGLFFALIFGLKKLPLLTLIVSVLDFYVFARILFDHFNLSRFKSSLVSLVLFFTPLHMYSAIGFMTENYVMLFMLLSLYFFLSYEKKPKWSQFILFNVSGFLAFFAKQSGLLVNAAALLYFLVKKKYKEVLIQLGFLVVLLSYYSFFFPKTDEMGDKGFIRGIRISHLLDVGYAYSIVYGMLLVAASFALPIVIYFVVSTFFNVRKSKLTIAGLLISAICLFFLLNKIYDPGKISWAEYPYFENTFERTGFFPRSVLGTKYQFRGNYKLFTYWDLTSKVFLALAIPCLYVYGRKIINIYSISIAGYCVLMIFVKVFFDRYTLPVIPLFILFLLCLRVPDTKPLLTEKFFLFVVGSFVLVMAFVSTQLAIDFVLSNNYIWGKSEQLVSTGVKLEKIRATTSWGKLYGLCWQGGCRYLFSYDTLEKNPSLKVDYVLDDEKDLSFPGSIFIKPKVYLYKRVL